MVNGEEEKHTMILQTTHQSGAEEWYCPICGRRLLMQWPPNYKKIILEAGDEYAIHSGGKGGVQIKGVDAGRSDLPSATPGDASEEPEHLTAKEPALSPEDETRLVFWEQWLEKVDFEQWWKKDA